MRTEDLLDAIGGVDDDLLQRSEKVEIKRINPWKVWVPLAACLCLVLGLRFLIFSNGFMMENKNDTGAESEAMKDVTNDGPEAFDNVYALSMSKPDESITATREVGIEIVKLDVGFSIEIEDRYTIFNTSNENIDIEFVYMYNMNHNGTRPVFVDEDGTIVGKAGTPIRVTIPANEHFTINGQYSKKADGDVELLDYYIHGCQFTNLDVTETWVTTNRDGNVEIVQIDPIEDYYLELN